MYEDLFNELNEATFDTIRRKHRSINKLFPDFAAKTKGVERNGGLRLVSMDKNRWTFKVHSGTKKDVWYEDHILFKGVEEVLKKVVMNRRLWSKSGDKADMRQVAHEFMKKVDVEVSCTCPAFRYWGPSYILSLSKYSAQYSMDNPETRAPNVRNPRKYGAVCKHLDRVLKVMNFYGTTITKWLVQFYGDEIARWEKTALAHTAMFKKAGLELGKKQEPDVPEPKMPATARGEGPEEEPPEDATEAPEGEDKKDFEPVDQKTRSAHAAMDARMRGEEPDKDKKKRKKKDSEDSDDEGEKT